MQKTINIAIAQQCALDDFEHNLKVVLGLLSKAKAAGASICFFPENCLYVRLDKKALPPYLALDCEILEKIKQECKNLSIAAHLGGVGIKVDGTPRNASLFIDETGSLTHSYSKQKLFDIELEGKHSYKESDAYTPGDESKVLQWKDWRFGQSVCYDLRFSEVYLNYAKQKVEVILVPSSFLVPTGEAHWHILNRARAIESQAYVIAPAQTGNHKGRHQSYGHSLVIDPWGKVLVDMEKKEDDIEVVSLHLDKLSEVRSQMPMRA
jgi:predicted amidohydrolase